MQFIEQLIQSKRKPLLPAAKNLLGCCTHISLEWCIEKAFFLPIRDTSQWCTIASAKSICIVFFLDTRERTSGRSVSKICKNHFVTILAPCRITFPLLSLFRPYNHFVLTTFLFGICTICYARNLLSALVSNRLPFIYS